MGDRQNGRKWRLWEQPELETRVLMRQVAKAPRGKERRAAQAELENAKARVKRYSERSGQAPAKPPPKVEVGCLEEVISKIEEDVNGDWGNVMFIPAGSVTSKASLEEELGK